MRRGAAFVLIALLTAGCTNSGGTDAPTPSVVFSGRTSELPLSSTAPVPTSSSGSPTSTGPARPTVPSDVPTTGPNVRPGETPPVMPVVATQHTPAGAVAFAKFFVRAIDWGFASMSGSYIRYASEPSCASCASIARSIDKARASGHVYIGGRFGVISARLAPKPNVANAAFTGLVQFDATAFEELDRQHKVVSSQAAHDGYTFEVSMSWTGTRWTVVDVAADR